MRGRRTVAQHDVHQSPTLEAISTLSGWCKEAPGDREEQGVGQDSQEGTCAVGDENLDTGSLVFAAFKLPVDWNTHIFVMAVPSQLQDRKGRDGLTHMRVSSPGVLSTAEHPIEGNRTWDDTYLSRIYQRPIGVGVESRQKNHIRHR